MSNLGFSNREEARRAARVVRKSERLVSPDSATGLLGGIIVLPGSLYSDTAYRYGVVTWLDGETKTYTDDTEDVLVCSHGTADPPAEDVEVFCTFHGIKDGYAVYCAVSSAAAAGEMTYVRISSSAGTIGYPVTDTTWNGVIVTYDQTTGAWVDGATVYVRGTTKHFSSGHTTDRYAVSLNGTIQLSKGGTTYPLYVGESDSDENSGVAGPGLLGTGSQTITGPKLIRNQMQFKGADTSSTDANILVEASGQASLVRMYPDTTSAWAGTVRISCDGASTGLTELRFGPTASTGGFGGVALTMDGSLKVGGSVYCAAGAGVGSGNDYGIVAFTSGHGTYPSGGGVEFGSGSGYLYAKNGSAEINTYSMRAAYGFASPLFSFDTGAGDAAGLTANQKLVSDITIDGGGNVTSISYVTVTVQGGIITGIA